MRPRFANILETIGRTPIVRINKLAPDHVHLFVKVEAFNPMGSVKDRLALGVIEEAERAGALNPGQTVVEATSGNTGIGLAMVCAQRGYPLVVIMSESFSLERRKILRFLGAKVVLTPAHLKGTGMLAKAVELAEAHGWFLCRQFENEANADMHSRTTAPEILEAFEDEPLDYWVTGFGTGGTLKGVARVLREKSPSTRIVVCEPDNSQLLGSGEPQPPPLSNAIPASHRQFRPHLMQGWSPDFIPKLTADAVALNLIDELAPISGRDAMQCTRDLATKEGIFTGLTGGATLAGGLAIGRKAPAGSTILCMLPDTGERYLSTPLFFDVPEDMTDEELEISTSTPSARFDQPAPPAPTPSKPEAAAVEIPDEARAFVQEAIQDPRQPVVLFALEWCEFCWSIRKLFAKAGIEYRSIDLDSVDYQSDNRGTTIRAALTEHTGSNTIPQLFIGGEYIGGATDSFEAWREGRLQPRLREEGIPFDADAVNDPYGFLPAWLQPR